MLGKIEGRRRRGWQRIRWLDGTTNSINMSLCKLQKMVKDRKAWHAAVHGAAKSQTRPSDWTHGIQQIKVTSFLQGYLHWVLRNSLLDLLAYRYSVPGHVNIHSKRPLGILSQASAMLQKAFCSHALHSSCWPTGPSMSFWLISAPNGPHLDLPSLAIRNYRSISMGHQRWPSILDCPSQACFYYWKYHESGNLAVLGKLRP